MASFIEASLEALEKGVQDANERLTTMLQESLVNRGLDRELAESVFIGSDQAVYVHSGAATAVRRWESGADTEGDPPAGILKFVNRADEYLSKALTTRKPER